MRERVQRAALALGSGDAARRAELEELAFELEDRHRNGERGEVSLAWLEALVSLARAGVSPAEAAEYWSAAELAAEETRVLDNELWVAWQRALSERDAGSLQPARERLERALERSGGSVTAMEPWILLDLAALARHRGAWSEGLALLERAAREIAAGPADSRPFVLAATALAGERAQTWTDLGLVDRAGPWIEAEGRGAEASGDPTLRLVHVVHRSNWLYSMEDHAGVIELVRGTFERAEIPISPQRRAVLRLRLGMALSEAARLDGGRAEEALATLESALAEPALFVPERFTGLFFLAELELRLGRRKEARAALADASRVAESWGAGEEAGPWELTQLRGLEGRLALEDGASPPELARRLDALRSAHEAFLAQWRDTPERRGGLGYVRFFGRNDVLADLVRLELTVAPGEEGLRRALDAVARTHALGTFARSLAVGVPGPAELQSALRDPRHVLLVHVLAPSRSFVFWVSREGMGEAELAPSSALAARRLEVVARLASRGELAGGEELVAALFPGELVALLARAEELTCVGLNELGPMPLEALPVPPALRRVDAATWGERFAIDHWPSLAVGVELSRRAARPAVPRLGVLVASRPAPAARERFAHLTELPWEPADLTRLAGAYSALAGREPWTRTGEEATAEALRSLPADELGVLHIHAHGVYDARRELPAALALFDPLGEGLFGCEEVEALAAPPLVILASCGSARGPLRPGEDGVEHLGGAFLRAGASCVVLSSYDLDDRASRALFAEFQRGIAAGLSPALAMRDARRAAQGGIGGLVTVLGSGQDALFPAAHLPGPAPSAALPLEYFLAAGGPLLLGGLLILVRRCLVARRSRLLSSFHRSPP